MAVVCNLHGGLGNQLFQLLVAEILSRKNGIDSALNTTLLGKYSAARGFDAELLLPTFARARTTLTGFENTAAMLRLPKVVARLIGQEPVLSLGSLYLVDGYFQAPCPVYLDNLALARQIVAEWRRVLLPDPAPAIEHTLVHIRLADWARGWGFDPAAHVRERLASKTGCMIMTDEESTVLAVLDEDNNRARHTIVPSSGFTAVETLRQMSRYATVDTNGSTLSFWAAVFACRRLDTSTQGHTALKCALVGDDKAVLPQAVAC